MGSPFCRFTAKGRPSRRESDTGPFLRCGGFAANTLAWAPAIRAEGVVRAPYLDAATAPVAEQDIAAAAVRVLLDIGHAGARYVITGQQSLTQREQAQAIGAAIGRALRVYLAGYVGRTAEMSPDLPAIAGRPATTFAEWAAGRAASFR